MRSNQRFSPTFGFDLQNQPPKCSIKKVVLKNFAIMKTPMLGSFSKKSCRPEASNFKREILARIASREFCEIFKNTFFTEHIWTTASGFCWSKHEVITLEKFNIARKSDTVFSAKYFGNFFHCVPVQGKIFWSKYPLWRES